MLPGKGMFWVTQDAADYERQQLNILRRHQGLPPIPPQYYEPKDGSDFVITVMILSFWVSVALFAPIFLLPTAVLDFLGPWVWPASFALLILGAAAKADRDEAAYQRRVDAFYKRWEDAGCP